MGENNIVKAKTALSLPVTIEDLYREFHDAYQKAQEAEAKVLAELGGDDWKWDMIVSYLKASQVGLKEQSTPQPDSETVLAPQTELVKLGQMFPTLFGNLGEQTKTTTIRSLYDLKRIFLQEKRRAMLEPYVAGLRSIAGNIRQALDAHLSQNPITLDFIVEQPKDGYKRQNQPILLEVTCRSNPTPQDAVLLTYIFTGKVSTGYNIFGFRDEFIPLPYGQLLVDAFGGIILHEEDSSYIRSGTSPRPATFRFEGVHYNAGEQGFGRAEKSLQRGIEHITGENKVVSNQGHVPLGVEIKDDRMYISDSQYFALVPLTKDEAGLVIAVPSDVKESNHMLFSPESGAYYSPFRLLTPPELGKYIAQFLEPLHNQGKINPNFQFK